jgi:hypothetical protein
MHLTISVFTPEMRIKAMKSRSTKIKKLAPPSFQALTVNLGSQVVLYHHKAQPEAFL